MSAATFAHLFRETLLLTAEFVSGERSAVTMVRTSSPALIGLVMVAALLVARWGATFTERRWGSRYGLRSIARWVRGRCAGPSIPATVLRTAGNLVVSMAGISIGRESAIMEMGGALGAAADRRTRGRGGLLATTGVIAAFAAAYHAPIAAVLYAEEHLRVRRNVRMGAHAIAGAAVGFVTVSWFFAARAVLPPAKDPFRWRVILPVAAAAPVAYAASRLFVRMRGVLVVPRILGRGAPAWQRVVWPVGVAALAAGLVVGFPWTAGNGLEGLRSAAAAPALGLGLMLLLIKPLATAAALGTGTPGGVVSPSLALAGGATVVCGVAMANAGWIDRGHIWDAALIVMAVAVSVSIGAPLTAAVMAPEMAGDYRLVLPSGLLALLVWLVPKARRSRADDEAGHGGTHRACVTADAAIPADAPAVAAGISNEDG